MNILLLLATIFIIVLYAAVDALHSGKLLLIRNIAVGAALYLCAFMIISLGAFAIGIYSVTLVYIVISLIAIVGLTFIFLFKYRNIESLSSIEKVKYFPLCLLVILIIGFLFTFQKFEIFGMAQDQGVYQMNALLMIDGLESNVVTVKEYELLTNDLDRQIFLENLRLQQFTGLGFYAIEFNEGRGTIPAGANPINSAIFHGLPNLPALQSVSGMMFGAEYLMHALTLPYLITIVLIFITLNINFGFSKLTSSIPTLVYALSPLVLWTSKASLTEIYLSMLIALLIYYLTSNGKASSWLLWIPVAAFAFFHVSIFVIMPMLVIIFIGLALYKRDVGAWFSGLMAILFYAIGYLSMTFVAPQYTFDNYMRLFVPLRRFDIHFFADTSQYGLIFPVCLAAIGLLLLVRFYMAKGKVECVKLKSALPIVMIVLTAICIIATVIAWLNIADGNPGGIHTHFHGGGRLATIPNLTIFAIAFGSGFVLCAIILFSIFFGKKSFYTKKAFPVVVIVFFTALFTPSFLQIGVSYYYYFARYIVPYIPALVILGGVAISKFRVASKIIVAAVSLSIMLPFSAILALNNDISLVEIRSQREIVEAVNSLEPGSIVLVSDHYRRFFFNSISFGTESYIFPHSVFVQFTDIPNVNERNFYRISSTIEAIDEYSRSIIHSSPSQVSVLEYWLTGWNPGPLNLLRPHVGIHTFYLEALE